MVAQATPRAELGNATSKVFGELADSRRTNRDVPAQRDSNCSLPIPRRTHSHTMDDDTVRITRTNGVTSWRAGCGESRTSGSEGGPERPTDRNVGRALRSDPYTYVPFKKGFWYLVAIMNWHSRKVLSWRVSNTMTCDFCVAALEEALALCGTPEIFNNDQGSQFTSRDFTTVLANAHVAISMDGVGRAIDNVFIEGLWRALK